MEDASGARGGRDAALRVLLVRDIGGERGRRHLRLRGETRVAEPPRLNGAALSAGGGLQSPH